MVEIDDVLGGTSFRRSPLDGPVRLSGRTIFRGHGQTCILDLWESQTENFAHNRIVQLNDQRGLIPRQDTIWGEIRFPRNGSLAPC
jgi:hypothetical protein